MKDPKFLPDPIAPTLDVLEVPAELHADVRAALVDSFAEWLEGVGFTVPASFVRQHLENVK